MWLGVDADGIQQWANIKQALSRKKSDNEHMKSTKRALWQRIQFCCCFFRFSRTRLCVSRRRAKRMRLWEAARSPVSHANTCEWRNEEKTNLREQRSAPQMTTKTFLSSFALCLRFFHISQRRFFRKSPKRAIKADGENLLSQGRPEMSVTCSLDVGRLRGFYQELPMMNRDIFSRLCE